ncbi:MAG: hypothetical protein Q7K98_05625 [Candidatus Omnitrophota bacterium]|nr:hypothetical protein [Candidatus Omnitrophota bacterium]
MDKKEIYEHLAKIYLDASSKKKKRHKAYPKLLNNLFIIGIFIVIGLTTTLFSSATRKNLNTETALILQNDHAKINFNFDPAKKETYTLNLKRLNLTHSKQLAFSVRNINPKDKITLRVEFTNAFKEKSEVYVRNIPSKWKDFEISLSEFKNINDWSEITSLVFSVEEWNASQKKGVVYIDNVRLLK